MVQLFVNGSKVGTLEENPDMIKWLVESGQAIEFRTTEGTTLGAFTPHQPLVPWDPSITQEELDRRESEPGGMTLKEFWTKMGVR